MSNSVTPVDPSRSSRFVVGLDLGTTNSAMAYVDTLQRPRRIQTFAVQQVVAAGQIEARETLPSFLYQPASGEFPPESMKLPWQKKPGFLVGHFARDHGTLVPGRMIASAKSWLCHSGIDRTANLLPWQGAEDVERLSPVAVSARYLEHFREAWDNRFPEDPLAQQDFVLTIPASFDEVARELTIKAAKDAGLDRVVLIEEPQAAFYAWIDKHADRWDQLVSPGQKILVCDVGGGTTDFTLIRVRNGNDGVVQFHRVAVGEHLILGGDNLDLALAHHLEQRIKPGGQLEPRQWGVLVRSCRQLKEILLGADAPETWTLTLPGSGSKLIGGAIQVPVTRTDVESIVADGFFPIVPLDAKPLASKSGFQEFGLPYADDPAVTKYLAAFLTAHRFVAMGEMNPDNSAPRANSLSQQSQGESKGDSDRANDTIIPSPSSDSPETDCARPDVVLFNGGVFASPLLRHRLIQVLEHWFRGSNSIWSPIVLENERLDLAVARGAAYYGMVRRGEGVRIAAGLARTYYIGVASPDSNDDHSTNDRISQMSALCLLPAGIEPGQEVDLSQRQFQLLVSQPIEFPLFVSSTRLTDSPGDLVPIDPEKIRALPPIRTVLKSGKSKEATSVAVILKARLTEIGTLDLWCSEVQGKRSWKLFFDVRSTTQTDVTAHDAVGEQQGLFDDELVGTARSIITETFGVTAEFDGPIEANPQASSPKRRSDGTRISPRAIDTNTQLTSVNEAEKPKIVVRQLEETLGMDRAEWPTSLLRQLWEVLLECEAGRWVSGQHEARWLNLLGFSLRPGYGLAVDDWRCNETWKRLQGRLAFATTASRVEWYILWRRIAGGLTVGQQQELASPLISQLKQSVRQTGSKGKALDFGGNSHESSELLRLLGACELLPIPTKKDLGEVLLEILNRPRFSALRTAALWAFGRIGTRQPVYGPLNTVLPPDVASRWLESLANLKLTDELNGFATMQLARKTGDRYRDIDESARLKALTTLDRISASHHYKNLVAEVTRLESVDQTLIFGESLPKGLRIL